MSYNEGVAIYVDRDFKSFKIESKKSTGEIGTVGK